MNTGSQVRLLQHPGGRVLGLERSSGDGTCAVTTSSAFWQHVVPYLPFSPPLIARGTDVFVSTSTTPTSPGAQGRKPGLVEFQDHSAQGGYAHAGALG